MRQKPACSGRLKGTDGFSTTINFRTWDYWTETTTWRTNWNII